MSLTDYQILRLADAVDRLRQAKALSADEADWLAILSDALEKQDTDVIVIEGKRDKTARRIK